MCFTKGIFLATTLNIGLLRWISWKLNDPISTLSWSRNVHIKIQNVHYLFVRRSKTNIWQILDKNNFLWTKSQSCLLPKMEINAYATWSVSGGGYLKLCIRYFRLNLTYCSNLLILKFLSIIDTRSTRCVKKKFHTYFGNPVINIFGIVLPFLWKLFFRCYTCIKIS